MSTDRFTEILNYLSTMSRDMGEFRQEFRSSARRRTHGLKESSSDLTRLSCGSTGWSSGSKRSSANSDRRRGV